jgi:UDP-glucose 4-epimerase
MYSSTSSGYGMNSYPNVETQPDDCLNPYSASKVAAEKFCKMYTDLYGLKTVVFRYFNVYGERSPVFGQYAPVIGIFLKQKNEGQPLTIVGDGSQRRDFIHVKDVAAANILAATADIPEEYYGQVFNIGSSDSISIQEIANLISDDQVYIPKREGEMETTFANIDKAKEILGWTPKINVSDWIRENL